MAVKYEPVVTLGNILAAVTFAVAGSAAWTSMSREVEKNANGLDSVKAENTRQDGEIREFRGELRSSIRDVQLDIKELSNKIGMANMNQSAAPRK